jgi:type I restriction enzyme S subunit
MTLGEIATEMYRGNGIKRDQVTESGTQCVRYGEIYTTYDVWFDKCVSLTDASAISGKKYFEHGDILFAITGEKVEEIGKSCAYVGTDKCLAGGDIVVMKHNQNPKYLAYALATDDAQRQKSLGRVKSKVVHTSIPELKKILVPIRPIEEQDRIVEILDRFTALIGDITQGLPAEIAARQKQYEYYLNKLLTFKELTA